jgi:hypothetical protein
MPQPPEPFVTAPPATQFTPVSSAPPREEKPQLPMTCGRLSPLLRSRRPHKPLRSHQLTCRRHLEGRAPNCRLELVRE